MSLSQSGGARLSATQRRLLRACGGFMLLGAGLLGGCKDKSEAGYTEVSGQALDAVTGQPVPGALVQLLQTCTSGGGNVLTGGGCCGLHLDSVRADGAGRFRFSFEAQSDYAYSLRATRYDYLDVSAFNACQPEKLPQVRKGRQATLNVPLKPAGYLRIHAVDDPDLTQYVGGTVYLESFFLGGEHQIPGQYFTFGVNYRLVPHPPDTSSVFLYPSGIKPTQWVPYDGVNRYLPGIPQPLQVPAHDTIEWLIRY